MSVVDNIGNSQLNLRQRERVVTVLRTVLQQGHALLGSTNVDSVVNDVGRKLSHVVVNVIVRYFGRRIKHTKSYSCEHQTTERVVDCLDSSLVGADGSGKLVDGSSATTLLIHSGVDTVGSSTHHIIRVRV